MHLVPLDQGSMIGEENWKKSEDETGKKEKEGEIEREIGVGLRLDGYFEIGEGP